VVFDPERVRDAATFTQPQQAADGIDAVWVNGVLTYREQAVTGRRAGRFVARGAASKLDAQGAF
jgi:N-acyl-D-aspartate/D-glutamate deacylase